MGWGSIVYRNCPFCKMKRVPHRRMENRKDSPVECENCGTLYHPETKLEIARSRYLK